MKYTVTISQKMQEVERLLLDSFVGMDHCITESGRNLIVEVPKSMCPQVRVELKRTFQDVALMRNAYPLIQDLHDFILVKPLISESPLFKENGVFTPELEKLLVDHQSDKEFSHIDDISLQKEYQRAFELYDINTSRLLRYATRKGKKEEVLNRIHRIDNTRVGIVHKIQEFFRNEPIKKAWLFGSFSRMEEQPDSDIDILIDIDSTASVGLMQYAGMINELESLLGRKVDLIAQGSVKPFAQESINRDKVLIYERA